MYRVFLLFLIAGLACMGCMGNVRYFIGIFLDPKNWSTPTGYLVLLASTIPLGLAVIGSILMEIEKRQMVSPSPPAE